MIDQIKMQGELVVSVKKGKKKKKYKRKYKNAISSELKNVMAGSLQSAQTFGSGGSQFATDNFDTPSSGQNGIIVHNSSPTYYETKMTSVTANTTNNKVTFISSTRASGASYTFTGAKVGHGYGSNDFDYLYASTTFTQAVADGQQLDLTWNITIG